MKRAGPGKNPVKSAPRSTPAKARKAAPRSKPPKASTPNTSGPTAPGPSCQAAPEFRPTETPPNGHASALNPTVFRSRLLSWYWLHARPLPWRGTSDPYRIWVSEIMLQQTRVAAVIDHYHQFLLRFPTLVALALAPESEVLAAWSGLGYYRRARMLHKAAHFILVEREGRLPATSADLRTLPGIGEYTAAAIASIAFGEIVAVVDGNVERVLLRLTGSPHDTTAAGRAFIRAQAQALLPSTLTQAVESTPDSPAAQSLRPWPAGVWDATERLALVAAAHPTHQAGAPLTGPASDSGPPAGSAELPDRDPSQHPNPAGDHNQAMMELGATICLPRAPLCLHCPVFSLCATRGEHPTPARPPQLSRPVAYLLDLRKRGPATEVLLEIRPTDATLMPSMYELPPLPLDAVVGREPVLRVRHSITHTNYYVQVFSPRHFETNGSGSRTRSEVHTLRQAIPAALRDLRWVRSTRLPTVPLTGLARKVLKRLKVMDSPRPTVLE